MFNQFLKFIQRRKTSPPRYDFRQANENLRSFIGELSHEINGRMDHVYGFLQLASMNIANGKPLEEITGHVEMALQEVQSAIAISHNVLDLSEVEAGKPSRINYDLICPESFFRNFVNSYPKGLVDRVGINLSFASGVPDMVICDKVHLGQILFNLVGNAVKYGYQGTPISIDVRRPSSNLWGFSVSNTGEGIPTDQINRIFEPFYTLKSKEMKGSGLGLFIVKKKVNLLNGHIHVESHPKGHTTFSVSLPLKNF